MKTREMLFRYLKSELPGVPVMDIIEDCRMALAAYELTEDFDHLIDVYFAAISLLLKSSEFDNELIELIENDLELFFPQLN